jgi:two-component system, cell cycle response regulator DivK
MSVGQLVEPRAPIEPSEAYIVVVEDTIANFILLVRMLSFMGVRHCEWKPSGWQVVPFAEVMPRVDLVLLDIRLPYEDGYHVLKKFRSHPRLKDTMVCAVTASTSEEEMKRAQKAGFNSFISKPLNPDRFPDQVRKLLAREQVWEWK